MKASIKATFIAFGSLLILTACGNSPPPCSDETTLDLVRQIIDRERNKNLILSSDKMTFEVRAIRTTGENAQTGAKSCAAELTFMLNERQYASRQIAYTIEITDQDEVYVTVNGLWW